MNNEILDQQGEAHSGARNLSVSNSFKRGYELFKKQWLVLVGALILFSILTVLVQWLAGYIDVVGSIIYTLFSACLYAGFFILYHQIAKGKEPSFSHFFGGFKFIKDITLYQLVYLVFILVASIPVFLGVAVAFAPAASDLVNWFGEGINPQELTGVLQGVSFSPVFVIFFAVSFVLYLVVGMSYLLTTPLIVLNKKSFWEAMELSRKAVWSRFFTFFALLIVLVLFNILGLIVLIVGVVFTGAISVGVFYAAYESLFSHLKTEESPEVADDDV